MSASAKLLLRKMFVAFLVAFLGSFLPFVMGLGQSPNWDFDRAVWVAALFGAVGAGIRAAVALSPINLVPSDAQHTIGGNTP